MENRLKKPISNSASFTLEPALGCGNLIYYYDGSDAGYPCCDNTPIYIEKRFINFSKHYRITHDKTGRQVTGKYYCKEALEAKSSCYCDSSFWMEQKETLDFLLDIQEKIEDNFFLEIVSKGKPLPNNNGLHEGEYEDYCAWFYLLEDEERLFKYCYDLSI